MKINVLQFLDPKVDARPAWVFSAEPVDAEIGSKLRESQAIVEAQWLINFNWMPCAVILLPPELRGKGTQLFGNTYLINKEHWEVAINQAEVVLINDQMYKMMAHGAGEDQFLNHTFFTGVSEFNALNLVRLFQDRMFVVAGMY